MPFEIRFAKVFKTEDAGQYINECCVGGDVVLAEIQKAGFASASGNENVSHGQEDWGWYLWFWRDKAKFEINICLDEEDEAEYRIHVIRQVKSGLFSKKMEDNRELEIIKDEVAHRIGNWVGKPCHVERIELE